MDDYAVGTAAGAGGTVNWPLFKWAGGSADKCALSWLPFAPAKVSAIKLSYLLVSGRCSLGALIAACDPGRSCGFTLP